VLYCWYGRALLLKGGLSISFFSIGFLQLKCSLYRVLLRVYYTSTKLCSPPYRGIQNKLLKVKKVCHIQKALLGSK
jgi:hypothetical protein